MLVIFLKLELDFSSGEEGVSCKENDPKRQNEEVTQKEYGQHIASISRQFVKQGVTKLFKMGMLSMWSFRALRVLPSERLKLL